MPLGPDDPGKEPPYWYDEPPSHPVVAVFENILTPYTKGAVTYERCKHERLDHLYKEADRILKEMSALEERSGGQSFADLKRKAK